MKTKIFTLFIAVLASMVSLNATIVDGIAYSFNKTDSTAQVIAGGTYSGHIVVPQYVRYKGVPFCVTSIGTGAFANSASLSSIALPNSVATIGDEAFKNCVNLDSCVLGKGLTSIGQDAFSGCSSLVALVTYAAAPPIVESGNDIDKDWCTLYLPEKYSAIYAAADWWSEFVSVTAPVTASFRVTLNEDTTQTRPSHSASFATSSSSEYFAQNIKTSVEYETIYILEYNGHIGYKFGRERNHIGCSFSKGLLQEGDRVNVYITQVSDVGDGKLHFFSDLGRTPLVDIEEDHGAGVYSFSLGKNATELDSIYLYRNKSSEHYMNPYVAYMEIISCNDDYYDTDNRSNEKELLNVQIGGLDVAIDDTIGIARLDWNVDVSSLPVTFSLPPYATADFTSGANHNFSAPLYITVTSERGTQKRYTLQTKRISENKCGDNVYYGVAGDTLYIEGIGAMYDYKSGTSQQSPFKTMSFSKVIVRNGVTTIGAYAFHRCTSLTSITIPNSVTSIGSYALQYCKGLTSVAIGNSVTSIGERAFNGCTGLTSVTIPNSVINIGNYAFASCSGLTSVTIGAEIPPIVGNISFDSSLPAIYVPCGTINSYNTEWSKYSSKIQYKPLPISVEPSEYGVFTYPTVCDSLLSVTSNYGYHFVKWNDDNTDNPRVITADDTLTLGAEFAINPTITYLYDGTMGNVDGDTILAHSATGEASFTAIANQGYHFVRWNDGNTDNPRTAHIICDTIFEAIFAPNMYALSISSSSETKGTVSDSNGEYEYMSEVQISANPTQGFAFTQWSDNNTENPRTIQMTKNISLIANFLENTTLQSITVGGKTVFIADTMTCFVADTIDAPSIEVIPFFSSTQVEIAPLITMRCGWKTTITLTALDGTIKEHLLTIIKGGTSTSVRATLTGRDAASKSGVGELYADAAVSVRCGSEAITDEYGITGYKLKTGGNYVAITLSNESFAEGDVLNIYTTNISNSANDVMDGYLHLYTDAGTTPLMNIKEHDVPGLHTAILGSGVNGKKAIYLYRTSNDMNPYVAYMEVVRDNDPRSDSALLFNVTIGKKPIEWNGTVGTIPVLPSNDISSMQVDFALSEYATADVPSGILHDFATPLSITVTAERGNSVTYTLRAQTQKCGDNLYWLLKEDSTLVIEGTGAMYDYANMPVQWDRSAVNSVELPKGMTTIGAQAFNGCGNIKSMTFGADVKTIGEQAFYNCTGMQEIYSYRATPPTAYSNTFDGIEKFECVLHVLSASVDMYKAATGWRDFYYVKTIDAEEVTVPLTKVEIEPHDNNVVVTWPTSDEATSYTLEITKDGVVFCTLIFNANGQLQGIAFAPGKNGTRQAPAAVMTSNGGLRFTVTGLDSGTNYHLTLDAKNELDEVVVSYDVDFETTGQADIPTGMEETDAETIPCKLLRNGQVFIQRGDKTYTLDGMEVK